MEVGNLYWFQSVALKVCSKTLLWGVSDCLFLSPDWCILLMCPLVSNWTKTKLPHATTVFGGFIKTSWNQWFDWCWCCHRDWIGSNTMHTTSCIHSASSIVAVDCNIVKWGPSQLAEACRIDSSLVPAWRWMKTLPTLWLWCYGLFRPEEDRSITVETSAGFLIHQQLVPENCLRFLHFVDFIMSVDSVYVMVYARLNPH